MKDLKDYLLSEKHLPPEIKDFHDQKDLFKAIHAQWQDGESFPKISWVDAHVYTIDIFLHWMALHGYKLQKIRSMDLEFYNLQDSIAEYKKKVSYDFAAMLNERNNTNEITKD